MNQVATTSLALILGIGGAYFLKEYNSEEATPAPKPTPSAPVSRSAPEHPLPAPTSGDVEQADASEKPVEVASMDPVEPVADVLPSAAALVPLDAFCYVQVESIEALESVVGGWFDSIELPLPISVSPSDSLNAWLEGLGCDSEGLDRTRPMGVALSLPGGEGDPISTFVLPVSAPAAFLAGISLPTGTAEPQAREGYVGISTGPNYRLGSSPAALGLELPEGQVAGRVNLAPVRQLVQGLLSALPAESDSGSWVSGLPVQDLYSSVEEFEFGLSGEGSESLLNLGATFSEDSALAMGKVKKAVAPTAMARVLDGDEEFVVAGTWSPELFESHFSRFQDLFFDGEAGEEDSIAAHASSILDLASISGRAGLAFADVEYGSSHMGVMVRPARPSETVEAFINHIDASLLGLLMTARPETESIDNGERIRMRFDLEVPENGGWGPEDTRTLEALSMMCGDRYIEIHVVSRNDEVGMFLASDESWLDSVTSRVGSSAQPDGAIQESLDALGAGCPSFLWKMDLRGLAKQALRLTAEHMGLDATEELNRFDEFVGEEPIEVIGHGSAQDTQWQGSLRFDWSRLSLLMNLGG